MEINVEYKDRYLKYKNKYLQLQKQIQQNGGRMKGGVGPPYHATKILPEGIFNEVKAQKAFINDNTKDWVGNDTLGNVFVAAPGGWRVLRFPPFESSYIDCMQALNPNFPNQTLFYGGTFGWEIGKDADSKVRMHYLLTPDLIYQFSSLTKSTYEPDPGRPGETEEEIELFKRYETPKQMAYREAMKREWYITEVSNIATLSTMKGNNDFSVSSSRAILAGVDGPFNGWVKSQIFAHLGIINPRKPAEPFTITDPNLTAAPSILAYKSIGRLEALFSNTDHDRAEVRTIFGSDKEVAKKSDRGIQLQTIVERYTGKAEFGPATPDDNTMFGIINNNYHRFHYCNIHLGTEATLRNVYAACFTPKHSNPWATDIFRQVVIYMFCDRPLPEGTISVGTWKGTRIYPVPNVDLFESGIANSIDVWIREKLAHNAHIIAAQLPHKSSYMHILGCEKSDFSTVLCSHYHTFFLEEQVSLTTIKDLANSNPAEILGVSNKQIHPNIAAYLTGDTTKFMNFQENVHMLEKPTAAAVAAEPAVAAAAKPSGFVLKPKSPSGGFNPTLININ